MDRRVLQRGSPAVRSIAAASGTLPSTPPPSAPLVTLNGVTKQYANGTVALANVDLQVRHGEFVTLVGPSGCGKSTVLRIIAGLGGVTRGEITVDGRLPEQARKASHALGFVFQDPTLLPWKTVQGNVELLLKLRGVSAAERARVVADKIRLVGLEGFEHAYPRALSGGMRMRVSIARALASEPKLLLMDEPFGALDEITRQRLNVELLEVWRAAQCTVLFVTHSVFEAVFLSTRVVVMSSRPGRVTGELEIDAPYPRHSDFRTSPEFGALASRVFAALQDA